METVNMQVIARMKSDFPDKFGIPRHNNFYHYISVSGSQRLLKAEDLGTVKKSILTDPKKEDWNLL